MEKTTQIKKVSGAKFSLQELFFAMKRQFKNVWIDMGDVEKIYNVFVDNNISFEDAQRILSGAQKKMILSNSDKNQYVNFNDRRNMQLLVSDIINAEDYVLYRKLAEISTKLKSYFINHHLKAKNITAMLTELWRGISEDNLKINRGITDFSEKALDKLDCLAAIYATMTNYLGVEIDDSGISRTVDDIMTNHIIESKTVVDGINVEVTKKFDKFLEALKIDTNGTPSYTNDEIYTILKKATSIINNVSASKFVKISRILDNYVENVEKVFGVKFSKNIGSKDIFLKTATLLASDPGSVKASTDLLLGKKMSEITTESIYVLQEEAQYKRRSAEKFALVKLFPNLKIEGVDGKTNEYVLSNNRSILKELNHSRLYDILSDLSECVCRGLGYKESEDLEDRNFYLQDAGFSLESILTKDNIFDICNQPFYIRDKAYKKQDTVVTTNITENVEFLSKMIRPKDIHKIIQHNFQFIAQNNNELQNTIFSIAKDCKSFEEFKLKFDKYINDTVTLRQSSTPSGKTSTGRIGARSKRAEKEHIDAFEFEFTPEFMKMLGLPVNTDKMANKSQQPKKWKKKSGELSKILKKLDTDDFVPEEDLEEDDVKSDKSREEKKVDFDSVVYGDLLSIINSNDSSPIIALINKYSKQNADKGNACPDLEMIRVSKELSGRVKLLIDTLVKNKDNEKLGILKQFVEKAIETIKSKLSEIEENVSLIKSVASMDVFSLRGRDKKSTSTSYQYANAIKTLMEKKKVLNVVGFSIGDQIEMLKDLRNVAESTESEVRKTRKDIKEYYDDMDSYQSLERGVVYLLNELESLNSGFSTRASKELDEINKQIDVLNNQLLKLRQELESKKASYEKTDKFIERYTKIDGYLQSQVQKNQAKLVEIKSLEEQIQRIENEIFELIRRKDMIIESNNNYNAKV